MSKIQDPALRQWASVFVGAAAANTVGGDAQTGGSTAASGTKNNDYAEGLDNPLIGLVVGGLAYLSSLVFPKNYNDFNPEGLDKREWDTDNGKIVKWINPGTNKAEYEWDEDLEKGEHYHKIPESGKGREKHPETEDTHMYPGDTVPE